MTYLKNFLMRHMAVILTLAFWSAATVVMAQVDSTSYASNTGFANAVEWLYGGLIIIAGYISPFIPGINKISNTIYRVLALAIIIGIGFKFVAGTSILSLVLTYTFSTSFYEVILKLFSKTKSVTPTTT